MKTNEYSRQQLLTSGSLSPNDLGQVNQCRSDHNRLGFAYQMGFARLLNRFPALNPLEILDELLTYVSVQLELDPALIIPYQQRLQTLYEHQQRLKVYLQRRRLGPQETQALEAFVFDVSCRLEHTSAILTQAEQFLKDRGILQPAPWTLNRVIGEQRKRARQYIFKNIAESLPSATVFQLNQLLEVEKKGTLSPLQCLKDVPQKASTEAMLTLTRKLRMIEESNILTVDLSWLHNNYQRAAFHYVKQCSVDRLRALQSPRREAVLTCFLGQTYRDTVDQMIDMYGKLINKAHNRAQKTLDERMKQQRKSIQTSIALLKTIGMVLLDDTIDDAHLREALFTKVSRKVLAAQIEEMEEWVTGKGSHLFYGLVQQHAYLRRFSPAFLDAVEFKPEHDGESSCLQAIEMLKTLNRGNRRKLSDDAPTDFIPMRLLPMVQKGDRLDKPAWECALLTQLRDDIKNGNLSVAYSKRFSRFDEFFIPDHQWHTLREAFFQRAGLPGPGPEVRPYLKQRLNQAFDRFLQTTPDNSYATVGPDGWMVSTDPSDTLDETAQSHLNDLKAWLAEHMRQIRLPDLLIEVDNELNFTRHFVPPPHREQARVEDICVILATIMAYGCNIGPHTMAQLIQDITYRQIKRVSDWQLTEEAQRTALAEVVNNIAGLETSQSWGVGTTSASDGQRFALPRRVLRQTYSPKFSDFALEFYSFVADNYAPFYSTTIECSERDAAFVLDGLLYNESDLDLEEHYTDTHGYTEVNFAAFAMLGKRFCPRIRGIQHQRIYRTDPLRDYGTLEPLLLRRDQVIHLDWIIDQWDRMGHFYASMEQGHVTASVALKRLVCYSTQNQFYRACRDLGRLLKTEFILQYMSDPALRRRIRRGLLKVDQLHALARDVYYGRRGRINARELYQQMNSCSCLMLILACIIYWQAKEIERVCNQCDQESHGVDLSLLAHVSPIEWENVILYGEYILNRELIRPSRLENP